jgi:hypothetical protein
MHTRFKRSFAIAVTLISVVVFAASSALAASGLQAGRGLARHARVRHQHRQRPARQHPARERASTVASEPLADTEPLVLLGEEKLRASVSTLAPGESEAFQFKARSSGTTTVAHVYLGSRSSASALVAGIYSSVAGRPGTLLTVGSLRAPKGGQWDSVALAPEQLLAGASYWLSVLGNGGPLRVRERHEGSCATVVGFQRSVALSSAWRTSAAGRGCPISAYVTGPPPTVQLDEEPLIETSPVAEVPAEPVLEETKQPVQTPPSRPASLLAPSIAGLGVEGQTLVALQGTWSGEPSAFSYQWQECDPVGAACTDLPGAVGSSFTLGVAEVGHAMRVVVTAVNGGGSTSADSPVSAVVTAVPPLPPLNTVAPSITGTAVEGQTLSASPGSWTGSPTSFSYQWQDCTLLGLLCSNISGATSASYVLSASDVGQSVRVLVTAIGPGGSTQAASSQSGTTTAAPPPPPVDTIAPSIVGLAVEGQTLVASQGTWSGTPSSYTYQWQQCDSLGLSCSNLGEAHFSTYMLAPADVGHTLRVIVTAVNAGGSTSASSPVSAVVAAISSLAPSNTVAPSITGTAVEGQTLSASPGSWTGSPTSFSYQWQDCTLLGLLCSNISGATSSFYVLSASDVGQSVRVTVTATGAGGSSQASSAQSAAVTAALPPAPMNTALPVVSGATVEGQALEGSNGSWSGSPTSFAYQWQRCNGSGSGCSPIAGASSSSYSLKALDVGHELRLVVTATNAGGSTAATSAASATVTAALPAAPVNTALPLLSGSTVEGQTLSVSNGSWSGSPTSFAYQWQRCNSAGSECATVGGASSSSYVLKAADVGHTERVVVTATNAGGSTAASSVASASVTVALPAAPVNAALPVLSGSTVEGQALSASTGSWSGSPTSFAYQWQRCNLAGAECASISGASASTYTLTVADVGHTDRVVVMATNAGGSASASSSQTAAVTAAGGGGGGEALFISPSGKDSSACTEAAPCLTMGHAYEKASAGETVRMLPGSYPAQTISGAEKGTAHVVFAPAAGASVKVTGTIDVFGSHVTVEGMTVQDVTIGNYDQTPGRANPTDVSLLNLTGRNFQIDSAKNVTVEGGSWGPASACGGPVGGDNNSIRQTIPSVAPENILINNTVIHDVQSYNLIECHIEGLAIFAGNHVTVSNSKFYGNSIYNVFIQANSGGSPNNVTIAKNWMAEAVDNSGANGHPAGYDNGIAFGSEISSNLTLMGNHFNGVVNINDDGSISNYTNTSMKYNFGKMAYSGYPCGTALKGVVWSENVWQNDKCGSTDVNLSGAAMPYMNPSNESTLNYTLTGAYANWPPASESGSGASTPANTVLPAITGTATQGQALSVSTGTWSGSPTSFSYQWQDCNSSGSSCTNVAGATAVQYTLAASDAEHTMRVVVTATGAGGSAQATSAQTSVVAASAGSGSGVLFVSGSGSDSGSCSEVAPCRSLGRAYAVAQAGEVVRVAAGSYVDTSLPLTSGKGSGAAVVFEPVAGASVRFSKKVDVEAHDVELKGFTFEHELYFGESAESVVARGNTLHNFEIIANGTKAPKGISIIGGSAGPVADGSDNENNLIATNGPETTAVPTKILIEGVLIHEYTKVGSAHVDCLQVWAGNELTVRGDTFKRCAVFDIFLQSLPNGSAGTPRNVTIENNVLEKTIEGFYSVFLPRHNEGNQEHFENVDIRNNSATQAITADPRAGYTNVKIDGNIAPQIVFWNEETEVNQAAPAGVSMDYNVLYGSGAKKIGAHDQTAAAGFVSESTMNLHLTEASAAIGHGDPADFPATDIEGNTRPNPPDAGAYQTGS